VTCITYEHIELPAKLLDYLSRSNNSNINQTTSIKQLGFEIEGIALLLGFGLKFEVRWAGLRRETMGWLR